MIQFMFLFLQTFIKSEEIWSKLSLEILGGNEEENSGSDTSEDSEAEQEDMTIDTKVGYLGHLGHRSLGHYSLGHYSLVHHSSDLGHQLYYL